MTKENLDKLLNSIRVAYKRRINVLYVHGYGGSNVDGTATILNGLLDRDKYNYSTIQLSNVFEDIKDNIDAVNEYISNNEIHIVIGNSLGGFVTLASKSGPYKILINPVFDPINGSKKPEIFDETFDAMSSEIMVDDIIDSLDFDFEDYSSIYGFFGDNDDIVNCQSDFAKTLDERKMTMIPNVGHSFGRKELQLVVDLVDELYITLIDSYDKYC